MPVCQPIFRAGAIHRWLKAPVRERSHDGGSRPSGKTPASLLAALALAPALLLAPALSAAQLAPRALVCEFGVNPLGVDVSAPRLSWKLQSAERGQAQTAFQILAASSMERLARGEADLWDSGKVVSDQTLRVRYAGVELQSSQPVFWKARVWDAGNEASDWSAPASWTMGLLHTNDWRGRWICAPSVTEALLLRKEFTVRPGLKRAVAHVSGLGSFEMFLNTRTLGQIAGVPGKEDDARLTASHNHFMPGQVNEWFYRDLAGIDGDPAGPGFKRILIKPHPVGDLTWVRAAYDSSRGKIASEWRRENGRFTLRVVIPPNTTATVFVPGGALAATPWATPLRREAGRDVFAIASGEYEFTANLQ